MGPGNIIFTQNVTSSPTYSKFVLGYLQGYFYCVYVTKLFQMVKISENSQYGSQFWKINKKAYDNQWMLLHTIIITLQSIIFNYDSTIMN